MKHRAKYGSRLMKNSMMLSLVLLLIMPAQPLAVLRQQTPIARHDELKKLDFLAGEWKGKGWRFVYGGARIEFSQSVKVNSKSDGSSLRIRDKRTYKDNGLLGSVPPLTATIYFDEGAKLYRLRRESSEGRKNPFELKLIEAKALQWENRTPAGIVRTTIKVTENSEWHETLEFWNSADGWYKAEESVLKLVK